MKRQMIGSAEGSLAQLALEGSITGVLPAFSGFEAVVFAFGDLNRRFES
jgi:hypothetical protein